MSAALICLIRCLSNHPQAAALYSYTRTFPAPLLRILNPSNLEKMETFISSSAVTPLKVFLVEDSQALTERLVQAITVLSGVELVGATDSEAVAIAVGKDVDVIVLDLHLKQGTGFGVMRALATAQNKPIIIVLTNFDASEYKNAALAYGADHFLDKARDFARLPVLLTEIRNQRATLH